MLQCNGILCCQSRGANIYSLAVVFLRLINASSVLSRSIKMILFGVDFFKFILGINFQNKNHLFGGGGYKYIVLCLYTNVGVLFVYILLVLLFLLGRKNTEYMTAS